MNWFTSPPKKGGENSDSQQQKFSYDDICNSRDAAGKIINQTIVPTVSSPAAIVTATTATATATSRRLIGWKEGIKECSQIHGSLTVSKEQLSSLPNVDIDWSCRQPLGYSTTADAANNNTSKENNESVLLLWEDQQLKEKIVSSYKAANRKERDNNNPKTPKKQGRSLLSYAGTFAHAAATGTVSLAVGLLSPRASEDAEEDGDLPEVYATYLDEENHSKRVLENALNNEKTEASMSGGTKRQQIQDNDLFVLVDLVLQVLQTLDNAFRCTPPCILKLSSVIEAGTTVKKCWGDWIADPPLADRDQSHECASVLKLVKQLPALQIDFLLSCLNDATEVLTLVRRENQDDLIVVGNDSCLAANVRVELFNLKELVSKLEARINEASAQAEKYRQEALQAKHAGKGQSAVFHLKRSKLYEQKVRTMESQLLKLMEVENALETSGDQRDIVSVLKNSSDALRSARQDLSDIDNVLDYRQEEREHTQVVNDTLSSALVSKVGEIDDGELLQQLNNLAVNDEEEKEDSKTFRDPIEVPAHDSPKPPINNNQLLEESHFLTSKEKRNPEAA